jgi:hypothetical protein
MVEAASILVRGLISALCSCRAIGVKTYFACAATTGSGARVPKEFESTALFFGRLIKCLSRRRPSETLES